MQENILKGSIIMVEFPHIGGSVQSGLRPAIVVSNNTGNRYSPVLIVVPLTSRNKRELPTHYKLNVDGSNGLTTTSTALCEQIITVAKDSVKRVIGILNKQDIMEINTKIKTSLALNS